MRLLDDGLSAPAVWVCGPPGAGKTSLVSSFIEDRGTSCVWYQVDEGDCDIATFFSYLDQAVANELGHAPKSLPHFGPERLAGLSVFTREYFRDLFAILPKPAVLVFDNFQEVNPDSKFYEVIRDAVGEAPRGCVVILISRNEVPAIFMRLRANQEMKVIGWDDIRLTADELKGITKHMGYRLPDAGAASQMLKRTGGWIAGLLLLLEHGRESACSAEGFDRVKAKYVFNYFMGEILCKTDDETRSFLLATSHLPSMTSKTAAGLTGIAHSGRILARLDANNFFIERRSLDENVYQYHPLFREFLLGHAEESLEHGALARIKKRAAAILSEAGQVEDAARLFTESEDWDGLSELLVRSAGELMAASRTRVLADWLTAMPKKVVESDPWLIYYLGCCRLPISPAEARASFEASYRSFMAVDDASGSFIAWSGVVDTYLYEWKDFVPLDFWIKEFEGLRAKYGQFPSQDMEERACASFFSALLFRQPLHPELPALAEHLRSMLQDIRDFTKKMSLSRNLILYYLWTGQVTRVGTIIDSLSYGYKPGSDPLSQLMYLRSLAVYYFYSGRYSTALEVVEEALKLADHFGIHLLDTMLWGQGVYSSVSINDVKRAEAYLARITMSLDKVRSYDSIQYNHQASFVLLHKGEFKPAVEHARFCVQQAELTGAPILENVHRLSLFSILISSGEHKRQPAYSKKLISQVRKFGQDFKSQLFEYSCLYMEALLAMRDGRDGECLELLKKIFNISKEYGLICQPFILPHEFVKLFSISLHSGLETVHVKEFIKMHSLAPCEETAMIEEWPWPVKICTFGRFEIYRDGKKIEFTGKVQQKPLALLKAVIAFGGKDVAQEAVTDALWPDSDGDTAYRSFATNLHRLRKLIGNDSAIRFSEGMLTIEPRICWVDTWSFSSLASQAEAASGGDCRDVARLTERALKLYRGPFLAGETLHCIISMRERLRARFLKQISLLASQCEKAGETERAIELYNRGIAEDELAEKFYRSLMHCHSRAGNRPEAIKTYKRCKMALSNAMDVAPSPETEAIYKTLL